MIWMRTDEQVLPELYRKTFQRMEGVDRKLGKLLAGRREW
jgi:hypothetical protein